MDMHEPIANLDRLSYGLVLLQEICQGYDTASYRRRAYAHLLVGGNSYIKDYLLPRWLARALSTAELILSIERVASYAKSA